MKFGQDFQAALEREEYPPEWIESAISYKKLKKCIKRVQQELVSLGLDKKTLDALWQYRASSIDGLCSNETSEPLLQYTFKDGGMVKFVPRLTIALDPRDGSPMDAWLSPETRRILHRMAQSSQGGNEEQDSTAAKEPTQPKWSESDGSNAPQVEEVPELEITPEARTDQYETVEIPLTSDAEFFQILTRELLDLETLQEVEQEHIQSDILELGKDLRSLKASKSKRSKEEIEAWRRIFELYSDAEVFISSSEQDAGVRDTEHAQKQLQYFTKSLTSQQKDVLKLGKDAHTALNRFMHINGNLLKLMKFQEINRKALTKILKKFDKRTALHTQSAVTKSFSKTPFLSQDLARATSFTISEEILQIIPQLNDYLCPICFAISYKPVRLRCQHVFCIRCLVVMQRAKQDRCPLCRGDVVMEATSENLDRDLQLFLKTNFKREVKEKQHANDIAAGIDQFGEAYAGGNHRCNVM